MRQRRWLCGVLPGAVLLAVLGQAAPAEAVTFASVDGHPDPVTLVAGETVTIRFDASKTGGSVRMRWARDVARNGKHDPNAPNWLTTPATDGGALDTDTEPGKITVKQLLPPGLPSGPYVFHLEDLSDGSTYDSPTWTVAPRPEAQAISGRVLTLSASGQAGSPPPDALVYAYSDSRALVANATIRPDGSYTLPVPPGAYILFAEWFGSLRSQRQVVNLVEGQQRAGVDLALLQGHEVSGTVRDGASPMADAIVQATAPSGAEIATKTFADGSYTLVLPSGTFRLAARGGVQEVTVADGPVDGVDFPPTTPAPAPTLAAGTVVTVAGNAISGYGGNAGPAARARITSAGIAVDRDGNLYMVDNNTNTVRKVDGKTGIITTVAGGAPVDLIRGLNFRGSTGLLGFSGDGGSATSAQLALPENVAIDSVGNLYISEVLSHRVRKVDRSGVITTVAGSGPVGPGQGSFSGDGGPATAATLHEPRAIALDAAGNLYIADFRNQRLRKVDRSGIITTVAGGGKEPMTEGALATAVALGAVRTVTADAAGNLFIGDGGLNRIFKVSPAGRIVTWVGTGTLGFSGDGGPATSAQYNAGFPRMAVDQNGSLYFADTNNHRIRKVSPDGIITTVAGTGSAGFAGDEGPATAARIAAPTSVAIDSAGNLYFGDAGNARIRKVIDLATPGFIGGQ
jgi:sugar lactone lactonase YvrE